MKKGVFSSVMFVGLLAPMLWFLSVQTGQSDPNTHPKAEVLAGQQLYLENCAACHGKNLEGQPDWKTRDPDGKLRAPPHDASGHTWHHDDDLLFDYTKFGGEELMARKGMDFNSGMPGFGDSLSDTDINSVLEFIKSTWSDREQDIQASRTEAERQVKGTKP